MFYDIDSCWKIIKKKKNNFYRKTIAWINVYVFKNKTIIFIQLTKIFIKKKNKNIIKVSS